ncbi:hypothetical protein EB795_31805 [Pseudomonas mandelii]|uniref:hypothetical protein n=1 Tax=Pseudomonas mandelii TaxID=75612 RepID=UPI0012B1E0A0|nr:hypothetical protein [Pseudomonas mandelii]MSU98451.1 hypothetical protein [Pseudomonas mandelii]
MKRPELNMTLELWDDKWRAGYPPSYFIEIAGILDSDINRPDVREWIEASPMHPNQYTQLRHLLMVLRKSKVTGPRRLTWRERITGRVQA